MESVLAPHADQNWLSRALGSIGQQLLVRVRGWTRLFLFLYLALRTTFIGRRQRLRSILSVVASQIYFTGWQALPMMGVLALATGGVVVMQSTTQLSLLGGSGSSGDVLVAVLFRELGPLLTALIVIARSGVAVATEVGNMQVNRETEALQVMGIDPMSFVVLPRLLGGAISVVCLATYYVFISFVGGYLAVRLSHPVPLMYFVDSILKSLTTQDMGLFLLKNIFSGIMIFAVACQEGLSVGISPHEVPQATTRAVVRIILVVVGFNLIVTVLTYFQKIQELGVF